MGEDSALAVELGITNAGREPSRLSAGIDLVLDGAVARPARRDAVADARGRRRGRLPRASPSTTCSSGRPTIPPGADAPLLGRVPRLPLPGQRRAPEDHRLASGRARAARAGGDRRSGARRSALGDGAGADRRCLRRAEHGAVRAGLHRARRSPRRSRWSSRVGTDPVGPRPDVGPVRREQGADADSPTSAFTGTGGAAHVTLPFASWGAWQDPRQFGLYGGGGPAAPHRGHRCGARCHSAPAHLRSRVARGRHRVGRRRARRPGRVAVSDLVFARCLLPRWTFRLGYTHWFIGGDNVDLNSGGYTTSSAGLVRFASREAAGLDCSDQRGHGRRVRA